MMRTGWKWDFAIPTRSVGGGIIQRAGVVALSVLLGNETLSKGRRQIFLGAGFLRALLMVVLVLWTGPKKGTRRRWGDVLRIWRVLCASTRRSP
jgi:hypothetical protein